VDQSSKSQGLSPNPRYGCEVAPDPNFPNIRRRQGRYIGQYEYYEAYQYGVWVKPGQSHGIVVCEIPGRGFVMHNYSVIVQRTPSVHLLADAVSTGGPYIPDGYEVIQGRFGRLYKLPGKTYLKGEWVDDSDPRILAQPCTWQDLGVRFNGEVTGLGCGTKTITGFSFNVFPTQEAASKAGQPKMSFDKIRQTFLNELAPYRGRQTGIVLALLNPTQEPVYGELLRSVGFKLLSKHNNFNHGNNHPNYLYGWCCDENRDEVKETEKKF